MDSIPLVLDGHRTLLKIGADLVHLEMIANYAPTPQRRILLDFCWELRGGPDKTLCTFCYEWVGKKAALACWVCAGAHANGFVPSPMKYGEGAGRPGSKSET